MTTIRTILAGGLALAALTGCATSRPVTIGQPLNEVRRQTSFEPKSRFIHEGKIYAVGEMSNSAGHYSECLVFIDDRLACRGYAPIPGYDWKWVSQPDGLAYLASMLRRWCGNDGEVAPRELTAATVPIPLGKQVIPEPPKTPPPPDGVIGTAAKGALGLAAATAVFFTSFVALPVALPVVAVGATTGAMDERERARVKFGMSRESVEKLVGRPRTVINLDGSDTQVLAYIQGDWSLNFSRNWYVGIRDQQVIWIHTWDKWLNSLASEAIENERKRR